MFICVCSAYVQVLTTNIKTWGKNILSLWTFHSLTNVSYQLMVVFVVLDKGQINDICYCVVIFLTNLKITLKLYSKNESYIWFGKNKCQGIVSTGKSFAIVDSIFDVC